jgi:bifunctional DNase/RNase
MIRYIVIVPILALMVLFLAYIGSGQKGTVPGDLVKVELTDLGRDPESGSPVLILTDLKQGRVLPIFIGISEASAISKGMERGEGSRPLTHDLLVNMLTLMEADLRRVEITALKENVFYADLVVGLKEKEVRVDSRPSDAIAVAVRLHAPIYVASDVLEVSASEELTQWWRREGATSNMGLEIQELTEELAGALGAESTAGVLVSFVREGGVAAENGLETGDIILAIDGEEVSDPVQMAALLTEKSGRGVKFLILRKGKELILTIPVPAHIEGELHEP